MGWWGYGVESGLGDMTFWMANSFESPLHLRNHPELLTEVGYFMLLFTRLESCAHLALAGLVENSKAPIAILGHIDSISTKFAILFDLAALYTDHRIANALAILKPQILELTAIRNKLAHGVLFVDEKTGLYKIVSSMLKPAPGRVSTLTLDVDKMRDYCDRLEVVNHALMIACEGVEAFSPRDWPE